MQRLESGDVWGSKLPLVHKFEKLYYIALMTNSDNPRLKDSLLSIGQIDYVFSGLVGVMLGSYDSLGKRIYDPDTVQFPVEENGVRTANIVARINKSLRPTVVADVELLPTFTAYGPRNVILNESGKWGGYEAIYVTDNQATIQFPKKIEGVPLTIELTPGTLLILPAPVSYQWDNIGPRGIDFRYVCEPVEQCSLFSMI